MIKYAAASAALLFLAVAAQAQPTYSREVSRIIQQKCQMCHRPNDIAPFALMNYDDAYAQARAMRSAVSDGIMPPWKPVPGHGSFKNNLSLSDAQKQTIIDWVSAGAPEGDPADLPAPVIYSDEWRLGQPDQIVSMPVAYFPVARDDRPDRYRCFILPAVVDQDRWVRAVDIVPGLRQNVHHVLLYLTDDPAQIALANQFEAEDSDPGYDCWGGPRITPGAGPGLVKEAGGLLGGWVPGAAVAELPSDIGALVPKGAYMIMQVHYNLDAGVPPAPDQTRIGLYFHDHTPKSRLFYFPLLNDKFVLQPNTDGQQVNASFTLSFDSIGFPLPQALAPKFSAIRVAPHMHQLGRQIRADVQQPDGSSVPLVEIDDWDFHWQGFYDYATPVPLPYGSKITGSCVFDNSTDHEVRWGESTEDEMCLVFVGFIAEGGVAWLLGNPL
jgi:cytochrome c551/c552